MRFAIPSTSQSSTTAVWERDQKASGLRGRSLQLSVCERPEVSLFFADWILGVSPSSLGNGPNASQCCRVGPFLKWHSSLSSLKKYPVSWALVFIALVFLCLATAQLAMSLRASSPVPASDPVFVPSGASNTAPQVSMMLDGLDSTTQLAQVSVQVLLPFDYTREYLAVPGGPVACSTAPDVCSPTVLASKSQVALAIYLEGLNPPRTLVTPLKRVSFEKIFRASPFALADNATTIQFSIPADGQPASFPGDVYGFRIDAVRMIDPGSGKTHRTLYYPGLEAGPSVSGHFEVTNRAESNPALPSAYQHLTAIIDRPFWSEQAEYYMFASGPLVIAAALLVLVVSRRELAEWTSLLAVAAALISAVSIRAALVPPDIPVFTRIDFVLGLSTTLTILVVALTNLRMSVSKVSSSGRDPACAAGSGGSRR
jgi:hypothetical protein